MPSHWWSLKKQGEIVPVAALKGTNTDELLKYLPKEEEEGEEKEKKSLLARIFSKERKKVQE